MSIFSFSSTAEEVTDGVSLAGKAVVITGVNSGLGRESARVLALRGADIIGLARTEAKAEGALAELGIEGVGLACELSDAVSVRGCVAALHGLGRPLDVVLCNAGIMALPERRAEHGIELQFLTNHLGHFMLVTGVLDSLAKTGRVVIVSSGAHRMAPTEGIDFDDLSGERTYDAWRQYGQSKLANILFARSLARRFEGTARAASSLHPGVIRTNLGRNNADAVNAFHDQMDPAKIKTVAQGAATQCLLAARPNATGTQGRYYSDCQLGKTTPLGRDDELAERLWAKSEELAARLPRADGGRRG